ncbi:MAG: hypothetical protein ACPK85_01500 [Methanosarcina sp.]
MKIEVRNSHFGHQALAGQVSNILKVLEATDLEDSGNKDCRKFCNYWNFSLTAP